MSKHLWYSQSGGNEYALDGEGAAKVAKKSVDLLSAFFVGSVAVCSFHM